MKDYVSTYGNMDAADAADILSAMTDDLDLAADILSSLTSAQRAAIMAEMDPSIAARLSKIMKP
jgi:flagellar motility protein MotE (MotC chaperone)